MKLAFSTNAYTRHPLIDAVHRIADAGYEGVEILADRPHAWLDETWQDTAAVFAALRERGLSVSNINANTVSGYYLPDRRGDPFEPSLSNPDHALRRWRIAYTQRCMDLASDLGCRAVSITSGGIPPDPDGSGESKRRMAFFVESLQELLEDAHHRDVRIGIEYEPGLLIGDADTTHRVIEAVPSPFLGVNLDIGHTVVAGEEIDSVIRSFEGRIWNLHVEDIRGGVHEHLIPGLGDIDFPGLLRTLKEIDYPNDLTVELYPYRENPDQAAAAAISFLRNVSDIR